MANVYVYSGAGGSNNGSSWANAYTTLEAAFAAKAAGDDFWVAHDHAQTATGALTITCKGTVTSPSRVICVNRAGTVPPVAADMRTTATITAGTTSGTLTLSTFSVRIYFYGISFRAGSGSSGSGIATSGSGACFVFDACKFILNTTSSARTIALGAETQFWSNTVVTFGAADQGINVSSNCVLYWDKTSTTPAVTGTSPTTLFNIATGDVYLKGLDLSAIGSGNSVFAVGSNSLGLKIIENCKMGASFAFTSGTFVMGKGSFLGVNCDSGDTNYAYRKQNYLGTITHETTIKRTGGASDGTTGISRKLVSTTNSRLFPPLEMDPIVIWNESTSSITVTVHVVTDNVTLKDSECWIEVEELGTSGYPLSVIQSDRATTVLTTPANQTTSTEAWTTTGLGTPVYQKLNVTFTPAEKGPIKVRVMLAKASTTVYVCPKVEVS